MIMIPTAVGALTWLASVAMRAGVLLVLAWMTSVVLKNAAPRVRHAVWSAAIVGALTLPLLNGLAPEWRIAIADPWPDIEWTAPLDLVPAAGLLAPTVNPLESQGSGLGESVGGAKSLSLRESTAITGWNFGRGEAAVLLLLLWYGGAAVLMLRLAVQIARIEGVIRRARPLAPSHSRRMADRLVCALRVSRRVRFLTSDEVQTPLTVGAIRPVVLVPAAAEQWSDERMRIVLTHELVHVMRHDWLLQTLGYMVRAGYWFNPLTWVAVRRLSDEQEKACDDAVIALGTKPSVYATHLVNVAQGLPLRYAAGAALPMARTSRLEGRLKSMIESSPVRGGARKHAIVAMAAMAVLACGVASAQPTLELRMTERPEGLGYVTDEAGTGVAYKRLDYATITDASSEPMTVRPIAVQGAECLDNIVPDRPEMRGRFSGSLSTSTRDGRNIIRRRIGYFGNGDFILETDLEDDVCLYLFVRDSVVFGEDGAIVYMERDALVELATSDRGSRRRMMIRGLRIDERELEWFVNGDGRTFDDDAQAWLDATLPVVADVRQIAELRSQRSSLRGRISSIRGQRSSLRGSISSIRGQRSSLRGQISSIRGQLSSLRGRVSSVRGGESSLRGRISSIRGRESSMRGSISSIRARMSEISRQIRVLDDLNAAPRVRDSLQQQLEEYQSRIEQTRREIDEWDTDEQVAAVRQQIAGLETTRRIAEVEAQIAQLNTEGRIAEVERQLADLQVEDRVAEIEREIEALNVEARVEEIEREIDELNADQRIDRLEDSLAEKYRRLRRVTR